MVDPNLRCQVANAMVAALPPIPDGTCISNIATDMAEIMVSTAAKRAPRSKSLRGAQGWCAGPGVETDIEGKMITERGSEEAPTRRTPQQQPSKDRQDGWQKSSEGLQGCRASSGPSSANWKHAFGKAIRPASTST